MSGASRVGERARVLIVDDEEVIARTLQEFLEGEGFSVATAGDARSALGAVEALDPDLVICDLQLPGMDGLELLERILEARPGTLAMMITAYATVENAVAAFQRGAQDYLIKPVLFDELLTKIDRALRLRRLSLENQALRRQIRGGEGGEGGDPLDALVGETAAMRRVKTLARKVAPTRSNVLITGESGTGKELVARALHDLGPNPDSPFLAVNCAAIPADLLENQLFGHVRGAFTGADRDHAGLFVAAADGTLFLDEIGEIPPTTQAKLLRAIEAKEVLPIGATRATHVKARVVAATNRDLEAEAGAGRFRADLYYRLNVVSIALPPLRERPEDIPRLVERLLAKHARRLGRRAPTVDAGLMAKLRARPWKGNVRELENALERAVILAEGPRLRLEDLWPGPGPEGGDVGDSDSGSGSGSGVSEAEAEAVGGSGSGSGSWSDAEDYRTAMAGFERELLRRALARHGGDKREAARALGLGLSSLYRKLEDHGLR